VTDVSRLFVGVWPPEEVLDVVEGLRREGRARWTRREQWHVTLRFLGEAEPAAAIAALATLRASAAGAVLGPTVRRLGRGVVQVPVAGLDDLAAAVTAATAGIGVEPERRPFRGHLTLARVDGKVPPGVLGQPITARFPVDEVCLVASHLGTGPARYETLLRVPLPATPHPEIA
jgi:2'-5' RNA ligase